MTSPPSALGRDLVSGLPLGACAGLAAFAFYFDRLRAPFFAAAITIVLVALAWWMLCGASRWVIAFLLAAILLPPLPLAWGDAGPHPAMLLAGLGLLAGLARLNSWEIRRRGVSAAVVLLWFALLASFPLALLYSGAEAAAGTLARIGLFSISVYLFFYLADGPGRDLSPRRVIRLLFWAGSGSALFACLDFYFQFPAPARFAEQFVWLPGGVFRRAQGMFYEASTLGLFCVFLLLMAAAIALSRLRATLGISRLWLLAGATASIVALVLSFSRAAMVTLVISLGVMLWIERRRLGLAGKLARVGFLLAASLGGGAAALYLLLPDFLTAYFERFWFSGMYLLESPNLILSRRLESWSFLLAYLGEHPWRAIFGIGYKTLPYTELLGRPVVADNMYLSLLIETGVFGLAALLLLHSTVLAACYRAATVPPGAGDSDLRRLFGLWMFCFWCGLVVQMWSGDLLTYWRVLPAFFAALAIAVREPRHENSVS
jgi:O-antigen ligase